MIGAGRRRLTSLVKSHVGPRVARRQPRRSDLPLSTWDLSIGSTGSLHSGTVDLARLATDHGTPLHVVRGDRLDERADSTMRVGSADIFYSYKTNPIPAVLARLHRRGVGAEVISPYELWLALRLGVPADRIIYNGPAKSIDSLRTAIRHGLLLVNVNSASEAGMIARLAADERRVVNLGVRMAVPGAWAGQFGIGDVGAACQVIRAALDDPWVELRGVHVHRGSSIRDTATMEQHVRSILDRCDAVRAATGWHPSIVDVGGSLGCPTVTPLPARQYRLNRAFGSDLLPPEPADCITIPEAAAVAASLVASHADAAGLAPPRVVLEPGRAMTADTQFLLTSVVDVKDDGELTHVVLDAGINIAEPVTNEYHQLLSVTAPASAATAPYRLVGPICTPADVLYNHWRLPRLEPGHVLAIMDTGAYFVPFSTTFSFPKPAIVIQDGDQLVSCRRREEFDDVITFDTFTALGE